MEKRTQHFIILMTFIAIVAMIIGCLTENGWILLAFLVIAILAVKIFFRWEE